METHLQSNSKTARIAAGLFFALCIPLSMWDGMYVPGKIFVAQDPVATANNVLSNELMFRSAIVTHLAGILIFAFSMILFSRIIKPLDSNLSRLMTLLMSIVVTNVFILEVLNYSALMILKSEPRPSFDVAQQQEMAYLLMRIYRTGSGPGLGKLFFGLYFIPFGIVVLRFRLAPLIIGILLIIGGVGYVIDCCIAVLLQRPLYVLVRSYLIYTTLAYILALLWFLVKGVREPVTDQTIQK